VAYTMSGDLRHAVRSFRTALTLEPVMREAVHGLSNVLFRLNQFEKVTQLLTPYLEKRPGDLQARENLAFAYHKEKRYSSSRAQLVQALQGLGVQTESTNQRRTWLMHNIAVNFACEGDLEEGERWISKAIALCPNIHPLPYQNLARFYLKGNDLLKAELTLKECGERFPGQAETSFLIAVSLERQGRYDEAIEELQGLVVHETRRSDVYSFLGCMLADIKRDLDAAVDVLKKGFELFPKDLILMNNLAYVLNFGVGWRVRKCLFDLHQRTPSPLGGRSLWRAGSLFGSRSNGQKGWQLGTCQDGSPKNAS
jgi:tetratricopeptide (TPR) repeat protein